MADSNEKLWLDYMDNWNFCRFCRHLNSLIEKPTCIEENIAGRNRPV